MQYLLPLLLRCAKDPVAAVRDSVVDAVYPILALSNPFNFSFKFAKIFERLVLEGQDYLEMYFDLVVGLMEADQHRLRIMYLFLLDLIPSLMGGWLGLPRFASVYYNTRTKWLPAKQGHISSRNW